MECTEQIRHNKAQLKKDRPPYQGDRSTGYSRFASPMWTTCFHWCNLFNILPGSSITQGCVRVHSLFETCEIKIECIMHMIDISGTS